MRDGTGGWAVGASCAAARDENDTRGHHLPPTSPAATQAAIPAVTSHTPRHVRDDATAGGGGLGMRRVVQRQGPANSGLQATGYGDARPFGIGRRPFDELRAQR